MRSRLWILLLSAGMMFFAGCEKKEEKAVELVGKSGEKELRAMLGKAGGSLQFADGGAKLEIPAGLLREQVTIYIKREESSLDLPGKDFVGKAYRISPKLNFNPGFAKLYVPVDRELPGLATEIKLKIYTYGKKITQTPAEDTFVNEWVPVSLNKFIETSQDKKHLVFALYETISNRTTKAPFGLFQAAFEMKKP